MSALDWIVCGDCNGSGESRWSPEGECTSCGGDGEVFDEAPEDEEEDEAAEA